MSFSFEFTARKKSGVLVELQRIQDQHYDNCPSEVLEFIASAISELPDNVGVFVKAVGHLHKINTWDSSSANIEVKPIRFVDKDNAADRCCIMSDGDHQYIVPTKYRQAFYDWLSSEDAKFGVGPPEWASRLEGGLTFENPKYRDE